MACHRRVQIQSIVERVCIDVARRAKPAEGDEEEKEGGSAAAGGGEKSKSMNAEKLDRARKAKALRVAQAEEAMLGSFVRLVDYMCVEMTALGVANQLQLFLRELLGEFGRSGGWGVRTCCTSLLTSWAGVVVCVSPSKGGGRCCCSTAILTFMSSRLLRTCRAGLDPENRHVRHGCEVY